MNDKPLTETELAQIEARAEAAIGFGTMPRFIDPDIPRIIAEVERLRSQNEKLFNSGLKNFNENARLRDALRMLLLHVEAKYQMDMERERPEVPKNIIAISRDLILSMIPSVIIARAALDPAKEEN